VVKPKHASTPPAETPEQLRDPKQSFRFLPFMVRLRLFTLCHVAGVAVCMGWPCRLCHFFHIQSHVPLFRYFRHRWDRWVIKKLALLSIAAFLYLSAQATWEMQPFPWPGCDGYTVLSINICNFIWTRPIESVVPFFYVFSSATFIWVCITGALSQRLQNIKYRCSLLDQDVTMRLDEMKDLVTKFLAKTNDEIQIPPTPVALADVRPIA
jgi:hypothetical protein